MILILLSSGKFVELDHDIRPLWWLTARSDRQPVQRDRQLPLYSDKRQRCRCRNTVIKNEPIVGTVRSASSVIRPAFIEPFRSTRLDVYPLSPRGGGAKIDCQAPAHYPSKSLLSPTFVHSLIRKSKIWLFPKRCPPLTVEQDL